MTADHRRVEDIDRRIAAARARVAAVGGALHVIDESPAPVFVVSRWCMTRELADLDAVEGWLAQVERRG